MTGLCMKMFEGGSSNYYRTFMVIMMEKLTETKLFFCIKGVKTESPRNILEIEGDLFLRMKEENFRYRSLDTLQDSSEE